MTSSRVCSLTQVKEYPVTETSERNGQMCEGTTRSLPLQTARETK